MIWVWLVLAALPIAFVYVIVFGLCVAARRGDELVERVYRKEASGA